MKAHWALLVVALLPVGEVVAQGSITGTVVEDSVGTPIGGAVVTIYASQKQVTTDSLGRFSIGPVANGFHELTVKRVGYVPYVERLPVRPSRTTDVAIPLVRVRPADSLHAGGIASFEENRGVGLGYFITPSELRKQESRRLSEVLSVIPQAIIINGLMGYAWIATKREGAGMSAIGKIDVRVGARRGCYTMVFLDDAIVYRNKAPNDPVPLFNVNSISVDQIEAIEYYAGPAITPMQYSALNWPQCGVLVLHTRRAR